MHRFDQGNEELEDDHLWPSFLPPALLLCRVPCSRSREHVSFIREISVIRDKLLHGQFWGLPFLRAPVAALFCHIVLENPIRLIRVIRRELFLTFGTV